MRTKNKTLAVVEIAVVLCSVFLVALPAIAAEQNQAMQKATANTITTASEDDFVLGVYGNANEDDTIDMRDLTYVKLIFFGKKPETELADAKYDGKINPLDFIQIKLIIVGKEKELTVVQYLGYPPDITEKTVTVPMPIEKIVILSSFGVEALCAFGERDRIVGVGNWKGKLNEVLVGDKPTVGDYRDPDMEKILELKPDIVLTYSHKSYPLIDEKLLNAAGIPLVLIGFYQVEKQPKEFRNSGWMLGKQERAEELLNFEQQHINLIKERVKKLTPEQKIRVYFASYPGYSGVTMTCGDCSHHDNIELCGGINIFSDMKGYVTVDPEEVIVRNPQVIYATTHGAAKTGALGYGLTDTSSVEELRNTIMDYPGWDNIDAVKNGRVYFVSTDATSIHPSVFLSYMGKYFHPELFKDIDPVAIHREWTEKFLGIEYKGVYAYPLPS